MSQTIYKDAYNSLFDSVTWTHKIQRTHLDEFEKYRKVVLVVKIIFTGLSSALTVLFASLNMFLGTIITATVSMVAFILSEVLEKLFPSETIFSLKDTSSTLFSLRNSIELYSSRIKAGVVSDEEIFQKIEEFKNLYETVQKNAITTPNRIVNIAGKKLKERKDEEENYKLL